MGERFGVGGFFVAQECEAAFEVAVDDVRVQFELEFVLDCLSFGGLGEELEECWCRVSLLGTVVCVDGFIGIHILYNGVRRKC